MISLLIDSSAHAAPAGTFQDIASTSPTATSFRLAVAVQQLDISIIKSFNHRAAVGSAATRRTPRNP